MKKTRILAVMTAAVLALSACGVNGDLKKTAMEAKGIKVTAGDIATLTTAYAGKENFDMAKTSVVESVKKSIQYLSLGEAMDIELTEQEKIQSTSTRANFAAQNGGYKAFKKYAEQNGSSIEFFDKFGEAVAYTTKVNEKVEERIGDKELTDEDLKEFYTDNYMRVKHILIKVDEAAGVADMKAAKTKAEEVLKKLNEGGDFIALMNEYTTDRGADNSINGGETGYIFKEGDFGNPAFEDAAKALKEGEYTKELVEVTGGSYEGYHIIMRLDLPEDMGDKKEDVSAGAEQARFDKELDKMLEEYGIEVEVYDDVIDAITADMVSDIPKTDSGVGVTY